MGNKKYCVHASVLIENKNAIEILRNDNENSICLTKFTLDDLNKKIKDPRLGYIIKEVIDTLYEDENTTNIELLPSLSKDEVESLYQNYKLDEFIFVCNDRLISIQAKMKGIKVEEFKKSLPHQSISESFSGIIKKDEESVVENTFMWDDGILKFFHNGELKSISYQNEFWNIHPKTPTQNAFMELLLNPDIDVITAQSTAGFGKSLLALGSALYWCNQIKKFGKIFVFKHTVDVGNERLGFLPGEVDDKTQPYFRPIYDHILKLHKKRACNSCFINPKAPVLELDKNKIEFLPINFIRGMNIDNSYVIIDEAQNLSREDMRVILSRMGENVRVVILGDIHQIDNQYLNVSNNAMNWVVQLFKGLPNYGHIVLTGRNSRGPIADMTRRSNL